MKKCLVLKRNKPINQRKGWKNEWCENDYSWWAGNVICRTSKSKVIGWLQNLVVCSHNEEENRLNMNPLLRFGQRDTNVELYVRSESSVWTNRWTSGWVYCSFHWKDERPNSNWGWRGSRRRNCGVWVMTERTQSKSPEYESYDFKVVKKSFVNTPLKMVYTENQQWLFPPAKVRLVWCLLAYADMVLVNASLSTTAGLFL